MPERMCRDAVIDKFVKEKFEPPVRTKMWSIVAQKIFNLSNVSDKVERNWN